MISAMKSSVSVLLTGVLGSALLLAGNVGCDKPGMAAPAPVKPVVKVSSTTADTLDGQKWFNQACASCHGFNGQGMPRQGTTLRLSSFVGNHSDEELVAFIKTGRTANDPASLMKLPMPPKGTNPGLTDEQLRQIVVYIRQLHREANEGQTASTGL